MKEYESLDFFIGRHSSRKNRSLDFCIGRHFMELKSGFLHLHFLFQNLDCTEDRTRWDRSGFRSRTLRLDQKP